MRTYKILSTWGAMVALTVAALAQEPPKPATSPSDAAPNQIMLTPLWFELQQILDVKSVKAGDAVTAKAMMDATLNDGSKVAKGSTLTGEVSKAEASQNKSDGTLTLTFNKVQVADGKTLAVRTIMLALRDPKGTPGPDSILMANGAVAPGTPPAKKEDMAGAQDGPPHAASFPNMNLSSSLQATTTGVLSRKGKNFKLDKGVQIEIAAAVIPEGVDVITK